MSIAGISRRNVLQGVSAGLALGASATVGVRPARAAGPIQVHGNRYPALEAQVEKMKAAVPGTAVNIQLMVFDKLQELLTISLSSKSDTIDILSMSDGQFVAYVKNGWL